MKKSLTLAELEHADLIWRGAGTAKWKPHQVRGPEPVRPPRMSRRRLAKWKEERLGAPPRGAGPRASAP